MSIESRKIQFHADSYLNSNWDYISYLYGNYPPLTTCHDHDFYEIFLVEQGYAEHHVNGIIQEVETGILCFIRPSDFHYFSRASDNFRIINALIPENIMTSLFHFLGDDYEKDHLLLAKVPFFVKLETLDMADLLKELEELLFYKEIRRASSTSLFKIIILNIIVHYFPNRHCNKITRTPHWFQWLILEIQKQKNFKRGLSALYSLSGKSHEHVTRVCKKYLYKTPSQLINELRLKYSTKLLITTDISIIDIADESGFESLSYFYHRFKEFFGISPKEFRKKHKIRPAEAMP
jgi:AraC family cel operon transcriptional repressor